MHFTEEEGGVQRYQGKLREKPVMGSLCDSVKLRSYYRSRDLSNVTKIAVATAARTSRQPPPGREPSPRNSNQNNIFRSTKPAEGGRLCSSWRRRIRGGGGRYQRKLRNFSQAAHQTVGTLKSVVHVSTSAEGNVTHTPPPPPPQPQMFESSVLWCQGCFML